MTVTAKAPYGTKTFALARRGQDRVGGVHDPAGLDPGGADGDGDGTVDGEQRHRRDGRVPEATAADPPARGARPTRATPVGVHPPPSAKEPRRHAIATSGCRRRRAARQHRPTARPRAAAAWPWAPGAVAADVRRRRGRRRPAARRSRRASTCSTRPPVTTLRNTADGSADAGDPRDAVSAQLRRRPAIRGGDAALHRRREDLDRQLGRAARRPARGRRLGDDLDRRQGRRDDADHEPLPVEHRQRRDPAVLVRERPRRRAPAITTASAAGEKNGTAYAITANRWHSLTAVIDADADTLTFYTDGQRAGVVKTTLTPAAITQTLNTIGRAPWPDALFRGLGRGVPRLRPRAHRRRGRRAVGARRRRARRRSSRAVVGAKLAAARPRRHLRGDIATCSSSRCTASPGRPPTPPSIAPDGTVTRPAPGASAATVTLTARREDPRAGAHRRRARSP